MLATLNHPLNRLSSKLCSEFSRSDLIDSFCTQGVENNLLTLLRDRPVITLNLPENNSCSIPYWLGDERKPIKIPPSVTTKPPVDCEKAQVVLGKSARAQAIARMTRILSMDRAITRTAPMHEIPEN